MKMFIHYSFNQLIIIIVAGRGGEDTTHSLLRAKICFYYYYMLLEFGPGKKIHAVKKKAVQKV